MASVAKHITDFRLLAGGVDTSQLTDNNALILLNKIYRDNINLIKAKVKEYHFYNYWFSDTVIGQSEYVMPKRNDTLGIAGCTKVIGVSIKDKVTDINYIKLQPEFQSNLNKDVEFYNNNIATVNGFFLLADNSYFIKPTPTVVITQGIKVYGIVDPIDLLMISVEADIVIPLEYQDILSLGMIYLYYKSRLLTQEKNDALQEYKLMQDRMISGLSDRIEVPLISKMPNLIHLQ